MRWDIFCKVIDNHGDLGVCWRLAAQLARAGDEARLWVDDGAALAWMAPGGVAGVTVVDWSDPAAVQAAVLAPPPDVLVEAFGCDPEPALVAHFAAGTGPRPWINLEYLSAESYVERMHRLPSPVFNGPGAGLTKHFFYPGFTPATGGLLREDDLARRLQAFDRAAWLAARGIAWQGERLVSLFCYEPKGLAALLAQWASAEQPTRLLVTPGRATQAVRAALPPHTGALRIDYLPPLPQTAFDELLWSCDLNLVRGEDSLVRALWAGAPLAWQIYPQDDDAHHDKLGAFLDRIAAPPSLRRFMLAWNDISAEPPQAPDGTALAEWRHALHAAHDALQQQPDLLTQLRAFVATIAAAR
ncbi:elongation factor P maturation arginine rhamnosyltransferase EarP [Xylophilus rhododendri]|uniref:Protein-arginine rhamnosyltransferase n=1 Tax=Xylophilus rhododendri TaxID=2697032 RepID=A0A857J850_9BURK|nr:elongation factor P maturation arginine rhamnosyltransferase EarP [Xylophilus rhododendri]QHJ00047.1 elongation factor P maturation arginine rhamnosyltransferase EarP [Xylophilus rhododendri]